MLLPFLMNQDVCGLYYMLQACHHLVAVVHRAPGVDEGAGRADALQRVVLTGGPDHRVIHGDGGVALDGDLLGSEAAVIGEGVILALI